jgi:putative N6-adenine-specific DNA methylase
VLNCFAAIHPGLEPALVDELTDLGARATARPGGASFQADLELLYDVHLYSRLAGRVTVELGTGGAINLEALYNVVRSRNFKPYVWPGQPIEVKATTRRSHLKNRAAVEKKAELAIKDGLRGPRLPGPRPPREPARILVSVDDDSARVSVDASGELLHKRGWRKITAKAPIRENLAAAMLRIAEWVPGTPLVDPMCGSGTFPIEAATIAMGRAPGLDRDPDLLRWPSADHRLWERLHHAARDLDVLDKKAVIWASDRDPGAIKATTENARRAGVGDRIRVQQIAFEALEPPASSGLVVMNPPYGARIETGAGRFGGFARVLRERWAGWTVALVAPPGAKRSLHGIDWEEKATFSNGGIPVVVLVGRIGATKTP